MAHAYLISTNNMAKCMQVLLKVIKNIFCVNEYHDDCHECSLCHLIDINNLPSLKIIEPDGEMIKKSQILELKDLFSKNSQYTNESIYIIKNAHLMNKEAANTILKFLEEPDANVIGFFVTNAKDNMMLTIESRCQIIDANFITDINEELALDMNTYNEINNTLKEYLYKIEIEKKELILYNRIYLMNWDKGIIKKFMQLMLKVYNDILHNQVREEYSFLTNYSLSNLQKKINLILNVLNELNYNINVDMLLDSFIIEMDMINNESI